LLNTITLIGLPGSGKSACGKILAGLLNWKFLDTDSCIEAQCGQSIPQLFKTQGEAHFRQLETALLDDLVRTSMQSGLVLATGGGLPVAPGNFEKLTEMGAVVYLQCATSCLAERLKDSTHRPVLKISPDANQDKAAQQLRARLDELLEKRAGTYSRAAYKIDTSHLDPPQVAKQILILLGLNA